MKMILKINANELETIMDRTLRIELKEQLNVIKHLLKDSVKDGDITQKQREKIMLHIGAAKCILKDNDYDTPTLTKHVMRHSRTKS